MKKLLASLVVLVVSSFTVAFAKAPPRPKHPATPPEIRRQLVDPVAAGALRLVPSFTSVSAAYGSETEVADLRLQYRAETAEEWRTMEFGCPWFEDVKNHRGSVYGLEEDTAYVVRLVSAERVLAEGRTRTWKSEVPVARTVTIDPATARYPIVVSDRGTADGWVRYVAKGPLVVPRSARSALFVTNAAHVVFDDLVLRGADRSAIDVCDSRFVRIRRCDIADWGDDGFEPRLDQNGLLCKDWNPKKGRYGKTSSSAGILLRAGAYGVVVERCYVHEPHSRAHSWRYSHPYGPMAVQLSDSAGGHVLRWNDFIGCDAHRFDDTVGGGNDFYELGTFNRDSDVYGNFMAFANDDCLEIDGGQQNVRVFGNRFEAGFMGASVQGSVVSPSYVFDNVFSGCCDEFGTAAASVKISGIDLFDHHPFCAIFDNVLWGAGHAMDCRKQPARLRVHRNRCYGPNQRLFGQTVDGTPPDRAPLTLVANNETNLVATGCPAAGDWPRRPIPYVVDVPRIDGVRLSQGVVTPTAVRVTLTCGGKDYVQPFRVQMNDQTGWVRVAPSTGVVRSGESVVFEVMFDAAKMAGIRDRRAAFRIATADGFSRPVTVYAETDFEQPFRCERPGETAVYATVDPKGPFKTYSFDVPKDGRYWFLMRVRKNALSGTGRGKLGNPTSDTCLAGVDGETPDRVTFQLHPWSSWMVIAPGGTYMSWVCHYDLKAGRHTLTLAPDKGGADIEGLVLTDAPISFEPEVNKFSRPSVNRR